MGQGIKTWTKTRPPGPIGTSSGEAGSISSAAVPLPNEQMFKMNDRSWAGNRRLLSGRCQLFCQRGCSSTGPQNPNPIWEVQAVITSICLDLHLFTAYQVTEDSNCLLADSKGERPCSARENESTSSPAQEGRKQPESSTSNNPAS